jgi:hypothetical protein
MITTIKIKFNENNLDAKQQKMFGRYYQVRKPLWRF